MMFIMSNYEPFTIKSSTGTLAALYIGVFFTSLAIVIGVIGIITNTGIDKLGSGLFLLVGAMVTFSILRNIARVRRATSTSLVFDGRILHRSGQNMSDEQVDTASLTQIAEVTESPLLPPVMSTTPIRSSGPNAHTVKLQDAAGGTVSLQIETFSLANRRKVVAFLGLLLQNPGVTKTGDLDQAMADWSGKPVGTATPAYGAKRN